MDQYLYVDRTIEKIECKTWSYTAGIVLKELTKAEESPESVDISQRFLEGSRGGCQ